jgi:hypothetical protein
MSHWAVRAWYATTLRRCSFLDNIAGDFVKRPDGRPSTAGVVHAFGQERFKYSVIGVRMEECTFTNSSGSDFGVDTAGILYTDVPSKQLGKANIQGAGEVKLWEEAPPEVRQVFLTGEEEDFVRLQEVGSNSDCPSLSVIVCILLACGSNSPPNLCIQ